ncbi:MAG: hypothetical protein ACLPYS_01795 [Vulcanimicrobiaceae bacterium]|jgi:hypothetical protein
MLTRLLTCALGATFFLTACGPLAAFAAGSEPGDPIDGIPCEHAEGTVMHVHQHLALYDRGQAVPIPSDVGRPILAGCLYWIHTHTPDGIIHVESPSFRVFTLGEFFDIWGQPLSETEAGPARVGRGALRAYVDGRLYRGDPRRIELTQHADIVLEAGPPYATPPPFTAWQGL